MFESHNEIILYCVISTCTKPKGVLFNRISSSPHFLENLKPVKMHVAFYLSVYSVEFSPTEKNVLAFAVKENCRYDVFFCFLAIRILTHWLLIIIQY